MHWKESKPDLTHYELGAQASPYTPMLWPVQGLSGSRTKGLKFPVPVGKDSKAGTADAS